ncbi:hypothetical protein LAZ67_X003898 [Cordylochernes scorpioides]|uniref:Uncharacterized protein n=1 Tax=Cordylochernes scorpioides TaxID=51811 RepID=A0ABY6LVH3_9ARAC|nr:hypothetical protein LAZ67_X003898 [Cordylochernes scorpioides]
MIPRCRTVGRSTIAAGLDLSPRRRHTRTRRLSLDKQKRDSSENTTLCHSVIHVDLARHHSKRWRLFGGVNGSLLSGRHECKRLATNRREMVLELEPVPYHLSGQVLLVELTWGSPGFSFSFGLSRFVCRMKELLRRYSPVGVCTLYDLGATSWVTLTGIHSRVCGSGAWIRISSIEFFVPSRSWSKSAMIFCNISGAVLIPKGTLKNIYIPHGVLKCQNVSEELPDLEQLRHCGRSKDLVSWMIQGKGVPQLQRRRTTSSSDLIERPINNRHLKIYIIITEDETWCYLYEPQTKKQSLEWHTPSSPRKKKFVLTNRREK